MKKSNFETGATYDSAYLLYNLFARWSKQKNDTWTSLSI